MALERHYGITVARRGGFTLLEVLVAVGVFGLVAMGLLMALEGSLDAARGVQRESAIRTQLESRLDAMSNRPVVPFKEEVEEDGVRFVEEIVPEEVMLADRTMLPGFSRVRVTALWKEEGQERKWSVSHLVWRQ